jgi:hypothetical protein
MKVRLLAAAEQEWLALPETERFAMRTAFEKLEVYGDLLPFPHSSQVKDARHLRELRPRAGRSPWRAFYRRVGDELIVAAIGPEARSDRTGFRRAVHVAVDRLAAIER